MRPCQGGCGPARHCRDLVSARPPAARIHSLPFPAVPMAAASPLSPVHVHVGALCGFQMVAVLSECALHEGTGPSVCKYSPLTAASTTAGTLVVEPLSACTGGTEVGAIVSAELHQRAASPGPRAAPPRPWRRMAWPRTPETRVSGPPARLPGVKTNQNTPETKRHRDGGSTCTPRGDSFPAAPRGGARRGRRPPRRRH